MKDDDFISYCYFLNFILHWTSGDADLDLSLCMCKIFYWLCSIKFGKTKIKKIAIFATHFSCNVVWGSIHWMLEPSFQNHYSSNKFCCENKTLVSIVVICSLCYYVEEVKVTVSVWVSETAVLSSSSSTPDWMQGGPSLTADLWPFLTAWISKMSSKVK